MANESKFLGEKAVLDLYDIIIDKFVSKEEFEKREKSLASAITSGNALIAAALLKIAEAITVMGGVGGGIVVDESLVATNEEAKAMLDEIFPPDEEGGGSGKAPVTIDESLVATDEEAKSMLDEIFPVDDN